MIECASLGDQQTMIIETHAEGDARLEAERLAAEEAEEAEREAAEEAAPPAADDPEIEVVAEGAEAEQADGSFPVLPVIVVGLLVVGGTALVVSRKRKAEPSSDSR